MYCSPHSGRLSEVSAVDITTLDSNAAGKAKEKMVDPLPPLDAKGKLRAFSKDKANV